MKRTVLSIAFTLVLAGLPAYCQMPGMGHPGPGTDPVLAKLFGKNKAFTADAEFTIQDSRGKGPTTIPMTMSMSDGKTRSEIDMTQMKGGQLQPSAVNQIKQMGMDKMVTISLPDQKVIYTVYPNLHAYAEMPLTGDWPADEKDYKIEKTAIGKETIDGHPCEKNQVLVTDSKGVTHELTIWNATDLKDFPVKMEITEKASTIQVTYKNIKLEKPDAALFEAPADMTKYGSMQQMMQTEMMKKMGGVPK